MKNYILKKSAQALLCIALLLNVAVLVAQTIPYYMPSPQGYGRNATGGGTPTASNTVVVTTATGLADALVGTKYWK